MTSPDRAAFAFVGAFVDELARSGVRHACIAPGSRSAPLAMTIAAHPGLRAWMHLDERSGAFFALGMARALGEPVALVCTSGTAVANFLPALVEARSAGVPLLVLTGDRPPELREVGAAQTIDQNRIFGVHAKWFVDVALPEPTPEMMRYARTLACRAAAAAKASPAGPVHLNFPFREPLVPVPGEKPEGMSEGDALAWEGRPGGAPWTSVADAPPPVEPEVARRVAKRLAAAQRPLIVVGPQPDSGLAEPLAAVARSSGAPILADPLSQLRWGSHDRSAIIDRYDAMLRHEPAASSFAPDFILRFGGTPTSKVLMRFMQQRATAYQVVVDAARWPDPTLLAAEVIHADPRVFCEGLLEHEPGAHRPASDWLDQWRRADSVARQALDACVASIGEPFEGRVVAEAMALVPAGGTLFVSSSMPVRDLDAFAAGDSRALRVMANRGANGIDGVVSSALGAAAAMREAGGGRLLLIIGDIALYHDMNGLLAARLHALDATIVVLNNDGGGIFSFLPQAAHPEHFEQLFGTPHGLEFGPVAALYGARYTRADTARSLQDAVRAGIQGQGLHIVEVRTDRARNVVLHRAAWGAVAAALDASG